ncbi:MAG TPA: TadE family protein [Terriglobia bacterium]|nr:TadE family protein [Terriglobia bacterium]
MARSNTSGTPGVADADRWSCWRHLRQDERGSEIVEVAAIVPLFFLLLIGIFWFGRAYNIYQTITRAAREGARVAAAPSCARCGNAAPSATQVRTAVNNALIASGLSPASLRRYNYRIRQSLSSPGTCPRPPRLPTAPQICGVVISFTYPFNFRLPFTTINAVNLPAEARMKEEY